MNKYLIVFLLLLSIPLAWFYYKMYYITPIFLAKPKIQKFVDEQCEGTFKIAKIEIEYCPDLFHQPTGYRIVLERKDGFSFGVYVSYHKGQGKWKFGGSNIDRQCENAKREEGLLED